MAEVSTCDSVKTTSAGLVRGYTATSDHSEVLGSSTCISIVWNMEPRDDLNTDLGASFACY
jgi:hypothetical protein